MPHTELIMKLQRGPHILSAIGAKRILVAEVWHAIITPNIRTTRAEAHYVRAVRLCLLFLAKPIAAATAAAAGLVIRNQRTRGAVTDRCVAAVCDCESHPQSFNVDVTRQLSHRAGRSSLSLPLPRPLQAIVTRGTTT